MTSKVAIQPRTSGDKRIEEARLSVRQKKRGAKWLCAISGQGAFREPCVHAARQEPRTPGSWRRDREWSLGAANFEVCSYKDVRLCSRRLTAGPQIVAVDDVPIRDRLPPILIAQGETGRSLEHALPGTRGGFGLVDHFGGAVTSHGKDDWPGRPVSRSRAPTTTGSAPRPRCWRRTRPGEYAGPPSG